MKVSCVAGGAGGVPACVFVGLGAPKTGRFRRLGMSDVVGGAVRAPARVFVGWVVPKTAQPRC